MLSFVTCPTCRRQIKLDEYVKGSIDTLNIRERSITCPAGHNFSIFDGLLSHLLQPNHYNIFWQIDGVETGQERLRVGEWRVVKPTKSFKEIDQVQTIHFPEEEGKLSGVRTEASFNRDNPIEFCLMTSGSENEWGRIIIVDWIVYGVVKGELDIWRENLTYASRQLLSANYRPSVIQSAVAVESFVYDHVSKYLKHSNWDPKNIRDYIEGSSIDAISIQGMIRIFIQEVMGIEVHKEVLAGWMRLKNMRDALAHGDIQRYYKLSDLAGNQFRDDKARAEFAYMSAVRFIYEVLYPIFRKKRN